MIGHWEIILLLLAVVLLFGTGRISSLMGDVAKGIKSFKKGLSDDGGQSDSNSKQAIDSTSSDGDASDADSKKH